MVQGEFLKVLFFKYIFYNPPDNQIKINLNILGDKVIYSGGQNC